MVWLWLRPIFFYSFSFSSFVASSTSSWLIILKFFRTVNKHFPLTLVYKVLKNPVWCGLQVECAKMAETVMRDLQPLLWMGKDAFDGPSFHPPGEQSSVFPDAH